MTEEALHTQVWAVIPNDDTCVNTFWRRTTSGDATLASHYRVSGAWVELTKEERRAVHSSAIEHPLEDFAVDRLLEMFDNGLEIDASLVEIAMRTPSQPLPYSRLSYTRQVLPNILKARRRREDEPSRLTTWLEGFISGSVVPMPEEAISTLALILEERKQHKPLVVKPKRSLDDLELPPLDWDQEMFNDQGDEEGWESLRRFIAALVALTSTAVVVSVRTPMFDDEIYVQTLPEDDGWLHLEAASSKYVEPPLSPDALNALRELGWNEPEEDLPNFHQLLHADLASPAFVSELLTKTLRLVYQAKPADLYSFEPRSLTRSLLAGDFGPEFAVNPDLSPGRRGRLFLGIRFPGDIGRAREKLTPPEDIGGEAVELGPDDVTPEQYPHLDRILGPIDGNRYFLAERGTLTPSGEPVFGCWSHSLPGGSNLALVDALLARGALWVKSSNGFEGFSADIDVRRWVTLFLDDIEFVVANDQDDPARPAFWIRIGPLRQTPEVLRELATTSFEPDCRILEHHPEEAGERLTIWEGWRPQQAVSVDEVFTWVDSTAEAARKLEEAQDRPKTGNAVADLAAAFNSAGLGVPWLPPSYRAHLRRIRSWGWTTEVDPDLDADYLFQTDVSGPVGDHATIGHAGHGISSYALTWRIAIGPVAIMAQAGWGGAIGDQSRSVGQQAEIFHRVSQVVRSIARSHPQFIAEPRMRRYQWLLSDIRSINRVLQWDGRSLSWIEIEPATNIEETFVLDLPE